MSAAPPIPAIGEAKLDRRSVPNLEQPRQLAQLFDYLISDGKRGRRDFDNKRLGRLEIEHELELDRLHDWQGGGLLAIENLEDNPEPKLHAAEDSMGEVSEATGYWLRNY